MVAILLKFGFGLTLGAVIFLCGVLCVDSHNLHVVIFVVIFWVKVKALCLLPSLLPSFGLWVKLFLAVSHMAIHLEIIQPLTIRCILIFLLLKYAPCGYVVNRTDLHFWGFIPASIAFLRNPYIFVLKVYQRIFLVWPKEQILILIMNSLEGFNTAIIEFRRTYIYNALIA